METQRSQSGFRRRWEQVRSLFHCPTAVRHLSLDVKAFAQAVWAHPGVLVLSVVVMLVALGLGLVAVLVSAKEHEEQERHEVLSWASGLANHISQTLEAATVPSRAFAMLAYTHWRTGFEAMNQTFQENAPYLMELASKGQVYAMSMSPAGVGANMYDPTGVTEGWRLLGTDLFQEPSHRDMILAAIAKPGESVVDCAYSTHPQMGLGIPVRLAVFVPAQPNDTLGLPHEPSSCASCYDSATKTKFWGLFIAWVRWSALKVHVGLVPENPLMAGYRYRLTCDRPVAEGGGTQVLAQSDEAPQDPIVVTVGLPEPPWVLEVARDSWTPGWLHASIAAVAVVSLLCAFLLLVVLVSRRQFQGLLHAMVPPKVVPHLRRGQPFVESFETVTILFSDIVSYTNMASGMQPTEVVRLLNELYSVYDVLCEKYGLYKVETIGDAFMCVGGCPNAEDPVDSAVRVARMAQAMINYTRVLVTGEGHSVRIRVGLHSGPITAAVVGLKMPRYACFGDTVNTASRMESNSAPMSIHISATTAALLRASGEDFTLTPRGGVDIKGKGHMETFWLSSGSRQELGGQKQSGTPTASSGASCGPPGQRLAMGAAFSWAVGGGAVSPPGAAPGPLALWGSGGSTAFPPEVGLSMCREEEACGTGSLGGEQPGSNTGEGQCSGASALPPPSPGPGLHSQLSGASAAAAFMQADGLSHCNSSSMHNGTGGTNSETVPVASLLNSTRSFQELRLRSSLQAQVAAAAAGGRLGGGDRSSVAAGSDALPSSTRGAQDGQSALSPVILSSRPSFGSVPSMHSRVSAEHALAEASRGALRTPGLGSCSSLTSACLDTGSLGYLQAHSEQQHLMQHQHLLMLQRQEGTSRGSFSAESSVVTEDGKLYLYNAPQGGALLSGASMTSAAGPPPVTMTVDQVVREIMPEGMFSANRVRFTAADSGQRRVAMRSKSRPNLMVSRLAPLSSAPSPTVGPYLQQESFSSIMETEQAGVDGVASMNSSMNNNGNNNNAYVRRPPSAVRTSPNLLGQ